MTAARVNPKLLTWARERARLDDGAMAEALNVPLEKVVAWEDGLKSPSFSQAERWARTTHTPFGLLFVSQPPDRTPPPPDLRRVDGVLTREPSPDFLDLYEDVLFKHAWFRRYRQELRFPRAAFVRSAKPSVDPVALAVRMRKDLGADDTPIRASSVEERYRQLVSLAEQRGIWVLRSGTVAGNTSRPIPVEEFRGFAIADDVVPLVFINARDATTAQLFTLVHELAHLWLGESGVSDPFAHSDSGIERLCNAAAAEFLVPGQELKARWQRTGSFHDQCVALARDFKVSPAVIAIRARTLALTSQTALDEFLEAQRAGWKRSKRAGGGNFYTNTLTRNGRPFVRAVLTAATSNDISLRDGGELLNLSAAKVMTVARREGVAR